MDAKEFALWLINHDELTGAEDEEFAEFFVYLYNVWKNPDDIENASDEYKMRSFPINEFTEWLNGCLHEIIDLDSECCQSAWWKQDVA